MNARIVEREPRAFAGQLESVCATWTSLQSEWRAMYATLSGKLRGSQNPFA